MVTLWKFHFFVEKSLSTIVSHSVLKSLRPPTDVDFCQKRLVLHHYFLDKPKWLYSWKREFHVIKTTPLIVFRVGWPTQTFARKLAWWCKWKTSSDQFDFEWLLQNETTATQKISQNQEKTGNNQYSGTIHSNRLKGSVNDDVSKMIVLKETLNSTFKTKFSKCKWTINTQLNRWSRRAGGRG